MVHQQSFNCYKFLSQPFLGHDTKAMLNNSGPRYKRSRLEKDINKDVLGCVDTTDLNIPVYQVSSNISASPGTVVCLGENIDFTASDFTQEGSFLNFDWNFSPC